MKKNVERDPAQWEAYYADLIAAYQDALAEGQTAVAEATLTLVIEGVEPLVRRVIDEALGGRVDDDLAHDCWLEALEVIIDHARRDRQSAEMPAFRTWLLTKNGPLRNAVRRVLDEQLTGAHFSKAELALLRVAGGVRSDFTSVHGREPSFDELRPLVAASSDAWARSLVLETKPHLNGWEFEAEVLHKLTKSGSAGALRNLEELLRLEQIRQAHPDALEGGWDLVDDAPEQVSARAAFAVGRSQVVPQQFRAATAALSDAEAGVVVDRAENPDDSLAEVGRRNGMSAHAVKTVLAKSAATVSAPHAQMAFYWGLEDGFESGVPAVEVAVSAEQERPLGARLAQAAALLQV